MLEIFQHARNITGKEPKMNKFDFGAFQRKIKMPSHDKYLIHMHFSLKILEAFMVPPYEIFLFRGLNLYDFADLLIAEHGMVNGINLDGGGSASADISSQVVNYPSDFCPVDSEGHRWRCPRKVSSIICIKPCSPSCKHGQCQSGRCLCPPHWTGPSCDVPTCPRCVHGDCVLSPAGEPK